MQKYIRESLCPHAILYTRANLIATRNYKLAGQNLKERNRKFEKTKTFYITVYQQTIYNVYLLRG